mmetsp:Transcript_15557/g.14088  ORF Transcript_15557/g.14088 Transcript_15557/m.14088 type:complete len:156 (+) Transcript_15557:102-569(+)
MNDKKITSLNAGYLTTYEIRQELIKRNALDIPDSDINHRSMLARLIKELVIQETNETNERTNNLLQQQQQKLLDAKAIREQKKIEAIERSRMRQRDSNYFNNKQQANQLVNNTEEQINKQDDREVDVEIESEVDRDIVIDPFRSTNKQKYKIFLK